MKQILIVINTMGRAGAEKSLISLLKSFDYERVGVSLLSIINRGELFLDVPKEVKILNENPDTGPVLGTSGAMYIAGQVMKRLFRKLYIFKFIPYAFKNTIQQLKQNKRFQFDKLLWPMFSDTTPARPEEYDLCIAFIEGTATYYAIDKVKAAKKCVFVHVNYEKAGYIPSFNRKYYEKSDYICCISEAVREVFVKIFPEVASKTRIFPNIMLPDEIRANAKREKGFNDDFDGLRLLTVGRLHPQKGYDIAIPAFAALVKQGYDNVRWYVLGDGNERAHLLKLIDKHGLEGKFILLGSRPNPGPYVAEAYLYVQPSRFEGFPLTLQEALILNKPCLTTNFEGVSEMLTDGENAMIIELSEENITNALKTLIDDKELHGRIADGTKQLTFDFPNKTWAFYNIMDGLGFED
jgi:glycosyltransferase involved in cell wall biosynthesis